jgi:hypothetical protein
MWATQIVSIGIPEVKSGLGLLKVLCVPAPFNEFKSFQCFSYSASEIDARGLALKTDVCLGEHIPSFLQLVYQWTFGTQPIL